MGSSNTKLMLRGSGTKFNLVKGSSLRQKRLRNTPLGIHKWRLANLTPLCHIKMTVLHTTLYLVSHNRLPLSTSLTLPRVTTPPSPFLHDVIYEWSPRAYKTFYKQQFFHLSKFSSFWTKFNYGWKWLKKTTLSKLAFRNVFK